jgi:cell division transport system permease protein
MEHMDWGRIAFFLSEVTRNFTRNPLMQLAAIGTVTMTILILGSFVFGRQALASAGNDLIGKIEISIFLDGHLKAPAVTSLQKRIASDPRVRSVSYIPKAEGLKHMRDRLRGQIDTSLLTVNPLPDAFRVKVIDPQNITQIAASIRKLPGVTTIVYAEDAVTKVLRVAEIVGRAGLILVGLLLLTATIIIGNTIRLTVFARRREIRIMQLVGASAAYIRAPFLCEGFLHGIIGAALALGLLAIVQLQFLPKLQAALPFIPLRVDTHDDIIYALALLGVGGSIGIISSWVSVGRYLRT